MTPKVSPPVRVRGGTGGKISRKNTSRCARTGTIPREENSSGASRPTVPSLLLDSWKEMLVARDASTTSTVNVTVTPARRPVGGSGVKACQLSRTDVMRMASGRVGTPYCDRHAAMAQATLLLNALLKVKLVMMGRDRK